MRETQLNIAVGYDNATGLKFSYNNEPLNLMPVTRIVLKLNGALIVDSQVDTNAISWDGQGNVVFKLGLIDGLDDRATYNSELILYDTQHTNGQKVCDPQGHHRLVFSAI